MKILEKKAGSPLQKQEFQVKSFGLAHIRTRRVAVYVHDHVAHACTHHVVRAHVSRVLSLHLKVFGQISPKFILEEVKFGQNPQRVEIFGPEGLKTSRGAERRVRFEKINVHPKGENSRTCTRARFGERA